MIRTSLGSAMMGILSSFQRAVDFWSQCELIGMKCLVVKDSSRIYLTALCACLTRTIYSRTAPAHVPYSQIWTTDSLCFERLATWQLLLNNRASITHLHLTIDPGTWGGMFGYFWWVMVSGIIFSKLVAPLIWSRGSRKEHYRNIPHQGIICSPCACYNLSNQTGFVDYACIGAAYRSGSHHTSRSNTRECNNLHRWFGWWVRRLPCNSWTWCPWKNASWSTR